MKREKALVNLPNDYASQAGVSKHSSNTIRLAIEKIVREDF